MGSPPRVQGSWETDAERLDRRARHVRPEPEEHGEAASRLEVANRPELPATGPPEVFVSYASGDDRTEAGRQRDAAVDGLCERLRRAGYVVHRDEDEMRQGDWISTDMKAISRADHVLVILSRKYLESTYCMTELHGIYQHSIGEKRVFLNRIIPVVLDDAHDISKPEARFQWADYWYERYVELARPIEDLAARTRLVAVADSDFALYKRMYEWHARVADMLAFIADSLHPHGFDQIVENDYARVLELMERNLAGTQLQD